MEFDENDVIERIRNDESLILIARSLGVSTKRVRRVISEALDDGFLLSEEVTPSTEEDGRVSLSLLGGDGEVPQRSGLNWGLANAHVSPNDAYIPIRTSHLKQGFFHRHGALYHAEWDDDVTMTLVTEGTQPLNGVGVYPKQLCSFPDKSTLGRYLRERLEVPSPERILRRHLVTKNATSVVVIFQGSSQLSLSLGGGDETAA